jgi:hypothetical protein
MLVPIRKLGSVGVISRQDYPPSEIPPNAFSTAENVSFRDGCAQKVTGWSPFLTGLPADMLWMQVWEGASQVSMALMSASAIHTSVDAVNVHVATTYDSTGANPVTLSTATRWQSDVFGQFAILNNQTSTPLYSHSYSAPTWQFRELPGWGASNSPSGAVKSVRSYNNHLVALGVDANPYTVFLSDLGSPETIPQSWDYSDTTKFARRFPLQSKDGPIVDGGLLSDRFIVYQRNAAVALEYIGGDFVVAARRIFNFGLINADAWTQFDNYHFVVGENAIYIHDGSVVTRPDDNFIEKQFFGELSDPEKVFVTRDESNHEIVVYYAIEGAAFPTRSLTYNWQEKTWAFRSLGIECRRLIYGVGPAPSITWADLIRAWGQINETWGQLARTDRSTKFLQLRKRSVDVVGITYTRAYDEGFLAAADAEDDIAVDEDDDLVWDGADAFGDYLAYAERNYVDLDEVTQNCAAVKYVKGAYLQCCGAGQFDVQFGVSDSPRAPIRWHAKSSFVLDEDVTRVKVDFRVTGRYLHWRFGRWEGSPTPGAWRVAGMDLDIRLEGVR